MRPASALPVTRALLFDAGNTLLRMNYPAIAGHLGSRGHIAAPEAIEEAELRARVRLDADLGHAARSEEHTSELQSQFHLVCRLLLEKKKHKTIRLNAHDDTS